MKKVWRLYNLWQKAKRTYYSKSFVTQCNFVEKSVIVNGPFRIRNAGHIRVGRSCMFDSSKESPIRLDVGNRATLEIGDGAYLNEGVHIVCNISVTIGARCLIASDVVILDDDGHPMDWRQRHNHWPQTPQDRLGAPIVFEENVWIGTRAIILKGVQIGCGSVIGAGAVVTHSVPPAVLVAGIPAKIIRKLE